MFKIFLPVFFFTAGISGLAKIEEDPLYVYIDNGYLTWAVPVSGFKSHNKLINFPGNATPDIGKYPGMAGQIIIPCGYINNTNNGDARSFYAASPGDIKLKYEIAENSKIIKAVFKWSGNAHDCNVTYTTYDRDNKIFIKLEYIPRTDEINYWKNTSFSKNIAATLLLIDVLPVTDAYSHYVKLFCGGPNQIRKIFVGDKVKNAIWYNYYDRVSKNTQQKIDWFAVSSIEYQRIAGIIINPDTQPDYLAWYIQDEPRSTYGTRIIAGVRKDVKSGIHYFCDLILVIDSNNSADVVENVYRAFNVDGTLKGRIAKYDTKKEMDIFKWDNPEMASNLKIAASLDKEQIDLNTVSEIWTGESPDYGTAVKSENWWIRQSKLYILADMKKDFYVFIKKK